MIDEIMMQLGTAHYLTSSVNTIRGCKKMWLMGDQAGGSEVQFIRGRNHQAVIAAAAGPQPNYFQNNHWSRDDLPRQHHHMHGTRLHITFLPPFSSTILIVRNSN
jgi:hypothetical protein